MNSPNLNYPKSYEDARKEGNISKFKIQRKRERSGGRERGGRYLVWTARLNIEHLSCGSRDSEKDKGKGEGEGM